jgi:hypothetical protein
MREYAKLSPTFWTGATGRALRRRGSEAVVMALYMVSSPHSNMLGLFYQPMMYAAHETGLGIEGASKGLDECIACGFCRYDPDTEMVWVLEMAAWQIAEQLTQADKRCKGIQKDYDALPNNPFLGDWFDRYKAAFHLKTRREFEPEDGPPDEAPLKPHRSQEQEQEQEQEHKTPLSGPPARKSANGTRLPENWEPDEVGMQFAEEKGLRNGKAKDELAKFRDYWTAQPGAKGRKADWPATWRNWVRKAVESGPTRQGGAPAADLSDLFRRGQE